MGRYVVTNPLHADEYSTVTQCEAEVIRMCCNMYNGDKNTCGLISSGGTESIILAVMAARERAKERGVTKPNMVMSNSAHAAFDKASFFLQVELRKVPVTKDQRCDFKAMKAQIDSNTILLVSSAPDYPYGNYDPAPQIAALALKWGINCHLDACLGSFINPFIERSGFEIPHKIDFRVPGISSISCDPHKYGMGPKGVSVVMFRDSKVRSYQFFAASSWNGGLYATTTIAGSRPGNVIMGTWAVMLKLGQEGYAKNAKQILEACEGIKRAIRKDIPELKVASHDPSCVITLVGHGTKDSINPLALKDVIKKYGWRISPVQNPQGVHISMTMATA